MERVIGWYLGFVAVVVGIATIVIAVNLTPDPKVFPYLHYYLSWFTTSLLTRNVAIFLAWALLVRESSVKEGVKYFPLFAIFCLLIKTGSTYFIYDPLVKMSSVGVSTYSMLAIAAIGCAIGVIRLGNYHVSKLKEVPDETSSFSIGQFPTWIIVLYVALLQIVITWGAVVFRTLSKHAYPSLKDYSQFLQNGSTTAGLITIIYFAFFVWMALWLMRTRKGVNKVVVISGIFVFAVTLFLFVHQFSPVKPWTYQIFNSGLHTVKSLILLPVVFLVFVKLKKQMRFCMIILTFFFLVPIAESLAQVTLAFSNWKLLNSAFVLSGALFLLFSFLLLRKMSGKHRLEA